MKTILKIVAIIFLFVPAISMAAGNDVTLTTNTIIQVGSYTINVSGSDAVIQSITVNPSNFTVTMASGSSITISSPTLNELSSDVTSDMISNICNDSQSMLTLAYSGAGTITNTITPSNTICSGTGNSTVVPTPTSTPPVPTPTPLITPTASFSSGGGSVSYQTLANILAPSASTTAYLDFLKNKMIMPVASSINSQSSIVNFQYTFTRSLKLGMIGNDVKQLQVFLNSHGFKIATTGLGSPGHETTKFGLLTKNALMKFQLAYKKQTLDPQKLTTPTGFFGKDTIKVVNALEK